MNKKFYNFLLENKAYQFVMHLIGENEKIFIGIKPEYYIKKVIEVIANEGSPQCYNKVYLIGLDQLWQEYLKRPNFTKDNLPSKISDGDTEYHLVILKLSNNKYAASYMEYNPDAKTLSFEDAVSDTIDQALWKMAKFMNENNIE